jgi:undecaprenyl diphosphate synthase
LGGLFVKQSTFHTAIIMDGNGRWARARGLPRVAGHRRGADAVQRTVEAAPDLGIDLLTLYAFSADNWQRPADEVRLLMELLERFLREECQRCLDHGVRLSVIGRRDRLPRGVVAAIEAAEALTRPAAGIHVRLAVDYSAREAIARAAALVPSGTAPGFTDFARLIGQVTHSAPATPDVDLLIRTSGEQRLSDFLLWECAYAELVFTDTLWPDFGAADLQAAVASFRQRDRRFGRVRQAS